MAKAISKKEGYYVSPASMHQDLLDKSTDENIAWLERVERSPSDYETVYAPAVREINEQHRLRIANLPRRVAEHWALALSWWAGATTLLFCVGGTIRWVYRGFRRSPS